MNLINVFGGNEVINNLKLSGNSKEIAEAILREIKEITKFLQQPESELKTAMGEPDEIKYDEKGSKFYIYKKKKYGITCEKKFEVDQNKVVVAVSSRGCF